MKWLPLLLALAGCATLRYAQWPLRGPMLEIRNPTDHRRVVIVRDGIGRQLVKGSVAPNGRYCFRWPFVHEHGYLLATGSDTIVTRRFEPWSSDGWAWDLSNEPVGNPRVCR